MVVVGYSYIFCFSGHVDDLWTAAQDTYPILYPHTYTVEHLSGRWLSGLS